MSIAIIILFIVVVILCYPILYRIGWTHDPDEPHSVYCSVLIFSGLLHYKFYLENAELKSILTFVGHRIKLKKDKTSDVIREQKKSKRTRIQKQKKYLFRILRNYTYDELRYLAKTIILQIWKAVKPENFQGRVQYGLSNPMYTGIIYGILYGSGVMNAENLEISPNYLEVKLEGFVKFNGHFTIGGIILRIIYISLLIIINYLFGYRRTSVFIENIAS